MAAPAAPAAKAPPIYPGAGSTDPFTASFYANQAAYELSLHQAEAADQLAQRQAQSTYTYNRGVNERAEPVRLTANRNTANSQGLAESGVLAKTQGLTQTGYAQKNHALEETRRNAVQKALTGEYNAREDFNVKTGENIANSEEKQAAELEANPPSPEANLRASIAAGTADAGNNPANIVKTGEAGTTRGRTLNYAALRKIAAQKGVG